MVGEEALFSGAYSQPGLGCHMATALQNIHREVQRLVSLTTQLIYFAFAVSLPAYAYRKQGKPNSEQCFFIDYKVQAGRQTWFLSDRFIAQELEGKVTGRYIWNQSV